MTVVKLADYPSHNYVASELQLHIPEGGISALSNELLASFEKSNEEANKLECNDKVKPPQCELAESEGVATVVAQHYNQLSEKGVDDRKESRIFHMRNLNNWIKSRIIGNLFLFSAFLKLINSKCHVLGNALDRIREEKGHNYRINVLDLGCGKGGDLLKWERGRVAHVVCADIAETSIEQCKDRYAKLESRSRRVFDAEFIAADCSNVTHFFLCALTYIIMSWNSFQVSIKGKFQNPNLRLDLVSCQFAFHYSFESLPQAEQMLANVSDNLEPGGYFIGTTTDAYDIM